MITRPLLLENASTFVSSTVTAMMHVIMSCNRYVGDAFTLTVAQTGKLPEGTTQNDVFICNFISFSFIADVENLCVFQL